MTGISAHGGYVMKTVFYGLLTTVVFAAALCAQSDQAPPGGGKPSDRRSSSADRKLQQRLYKDVGHELRMMPEFNAFDNLEYKIDGTTVTLLGQVVHAVLKDEAEKRVKKVEGVDRVVNNIEILPPSSGDDDLRRQLARAIFQDPRLSRYALNPQPPIHIIVKMGHVALEGVVSTESEKNAAELQAKGVPGAFSVENHLRVEAADKQ
jgi:hyperosmotically inducible periplasmic protein